MEPHMPGEELVQLGGYQLYYHDLSTSITHFLCLFYFLFHRAPQNHWFGPAGDPRGCGIGTPEAIQMVWSCHREIINDNFVPYDWKQPKAT
jgi:hypothetical protein